MQDLRKARSGGCPQRHAWGDVLHLWRAPANGGRMPTERPVQTSVRVISGLLCARPSEVEADLLGRGLQRPRTCRTDVAGDGTGRDVLKGQTNTWVAANAPGTGCVEVEWFFALLSALGLSVHPRRKTGGRKDDLHVESGSARAAAARRCSERPRRSSMFVLRNLLRHLVSGPFTTSKARR